VQWENDLADRLPLDGVWEFALREQTGTIQVPGCWEAQGYARRVDGPAVFRRTVTVPAEWQGWRVQLQFDAVSYYAEIEVNGLPVETHTGSWSPFACDVTEAIRPGAENEIRLTVYKPGERFPLRESLAGFLPDVAIMFGGIWQSVRLVAFPGPALCALSVLSSVQGKSVSVRATVHQAKRLTAAIDVYAPDGALAATWRAPLEGESFAAALLIPEPDLWSPEHPARYTAEIRLEDENSVAARARRTFGFRELTHEGTQLLFNEAPVCLRGALNWGWYPDRLCPAPDEATIRDEFRRVRELGFNLMKLCLYVPSPLYFEIADQEGMFLWLELPLWLPQITPRLEKQALIEYADIAAAVHHHPSIIVYSLGCELERNVSSAWLAQLNEVVRIRVSDVLVCDNSGSGEAYGSRADLADFEDYHFYCDFQFLEPLIDHFHRDWRAERPLIFGEFCAADDYRDPQAIAAAHGGELPWWLTEQNPIHPLTKIAHTEQISRMQKVEVGLDIPALVRVSRQESLAVRKIVLEKVRARAKLGGYVVTGLRDTPIATSALFDDFNRSKYDPAVFRQSNADSVLVLGRERARQWSYDGDRPAPVEPYCFTAGQPMTLDVILAHAGQPLPAGVLVWQLRRADGTVVAGDTLPVAGPLPGGRPRRLARLDLAAPDTPDARMLHLDVVLQMPEQAIRNAWPVWVFPAVTAWPEGIGLLDPTGGLAGLDDLGTAAARLDSPAANPRILLTNVLTGDVVDYLHGGGSVVLFQQGDHPLPAVSGAFWSAIKIIGDHPLMNALPHGGFVDMQFYGLATCWAIDTGRMAAVLPDLTDVRWLLRRLHPAQYTVADYLVEARVGSGHLFASTLRFWGGLGDQPASLRFNPAARWLLLKLLEALA
jgi:hypothetical protein